MLLLCKFDIPPFRFKSFKMKSIRNATQPDVQQIARLWHEGWNDAHLQIVPQELAEIRTLASFVERTKWHLAHTRVAGDDEIDGFNITRGDELYQFYVSRNSRGTGLAKILLDDAEQQLRLGGTTHAWLSCSIGNDRAARFYSKCSWKLTRTIVEDLETLEGTFPLKVWKFEKRLV